MMLVVSILIEILDHSILIIVSVWIYVSNHLIVMILSASIHMSISQVYVPFQPCSSFPFFFFFSFALPALNLA